METTRDEAMPMAGGCFLLVDVKRLWIELSSELHDGRFLDGVGTRDDDPADAEIAELHGKCPGAVEGASIV
jgi:hypothetical protein